MPRLRSLRLKLLIGLLPLLAILVALGLWATVMFSRLGGAIDVILRENYRSVLAAQNMKEAIERLDSALLFAITGREQRARDQFQEALPRFEQNLRIERGNVTIEGEQQMADDLSTFFADYRASAERFFAIPASEPTRRADHYFREILPLFDNIKGRADDVLNLNQRNMERMDTRARDAATLSVRWMVLSLIGAAAVATVVAFMLGWSVLGPIQSVTRGAQALAKGDLDQVVPVRTNDELGELAASFNAMARTLRNYRDAGTARLVRAQQTAQATIDTFPDPVVVVDPTGAIERANPAARRILGVSSVDDASRPIRWDPPSSLRPLLENVLAGGPDSLTAGFEQAFTRRDETGERAFLPRVLAIRDNTGSLQGAALVLQDITRFRRLDELKSDMVSTVSHELKTPLTSVQMAIHLLLEEVVGPLNPKQVELLLTARQDSDRLLAMVNDLLDLTRIEQGRLKLDLQPVAAHVLIDEAIARLEARAEDAGIALASVGSTAEDVVLADHDRVSHVFDNLITNAIEHSKHGGKVTVTAEREGDVVRFWVADTGTGIAPEHLPHLFEKFFRVPGSQKAGGAGLGLAIVREIVTAHGGRVEVESEAGTGSTFQFTLPVAPAASGSGE
ncbi:MAG: ATP-binding protein [Isosphaeraceae bacterium]